MFLRFDSVELPAALATLELNFRDLDLFGAADTGNFFEEIRFYDENGVALTDTIDSLSDDNNGITPFTVSGNTGNQSIVFSNLTSIVENPFYLQLRFRSDYTAWFGSVTNTAEFMSAKLTTAAVPEPASMLLLGSGLLGVAARRRKRA